MPSKHPYDMKAPCAQCPFRTDIKPYLRKARIKEIRAGLQRGEFPCHKTITSNDDDERVQTADSKHCAGAMILLEKINEPSQMMRIAERLGLYDPAELDMAAPVYDSWAAMHNAQAK